MYKVILCLALVFCFVGCRQKLTAEEVETIKERQKARAENDAAYYKSREVCIDGVVYFMPSNGSAPLPKVGQDGLPVKCNK